jgi:hypothetical protein
MTILYLIRSAFLCEIFAPTPLKGAKIKSPLGDLGAT